jgi:hypothetical protein
LYFIVHGLALPFHSDHGAMPYMYLRTLELTLRA